MTTPLLLNNTRCAAYDMIPSNSPSFFPTDVAVNSMFTDHTLKKQAADRLFKPGSPIRRFPFTRTELYSSSDSGPCGRPSSGPATKEILAVGTRGSLTLPGSYVRDGEASLIEA
jgi:hypothetical protein